jgi:hypothetical protein
VIDTTRRSSTRSLRTVALGILLTPAIASPALAAAGPPRGSTELDATTPTIDVKLAFEHQPMGASVLEKP